MLTVAAFLVAIGVLVAIHEFGHYAMARACGVKVLRFSIGFGPRVMGWTSPKSGTEFVIGLLPLGGFVKMLDEREGVVAPPERVQAFNVQPLRRKVAIVAAGPLANLMFAVVLYCFVNWTGVEQAEPILAKPLSGSVAAQAGLIGGERVLRAAFEGEELEEVRAFEEFRWWLTRGALTHRNVSIEFVPAGSSTAAGASGAALLELSRMDARTADAGLFRSIGILGPLSAARLEGLSEDGAAARAGLRYGDEVLRVDETVIADAGQLRELIRLSGQSGTVKPQNWRINRGGSLLSLTVVPKIEQDVGGPIGRVGAFIGAPPELVLVRYGAMDGLSHAFVRTWDVAVLSLQMMGNIVMGNASLKNLSGPITIADYAGKSAAIGATQFVIFLALVSISLGVLNLLPVPVLDGGLLMYYLWESLTGKPVSEAWMQRLQRVGLVVLTLMMFVAVFNDITRFLG